jgi:WD40 repeat protein
MSLRLVFLFWVVILTFLSESAEGGEKRSEPEKSPRTDRYGDPLPRGAVARLGSMRLREEDRVGALAFSPDEKILASGGSRIHLWDPLTGKQIRIFGDKDTAGVSSLLFSPDGKTLVSLGDYQVLFRDGSHHSDEEIPLTKVHLWDVATGKHRLALAGHDRYVASAAFTPDGKLLASASADDTIRLWDPRTGKAIRVIKQNGSRFSQVFFTPDGKTLVTGSGDGAIRLWDVGTGEQVRIIKAPGLVSLHLSAGAKIAASDSAHHDKIRLWDLASGKQLGECPGPGTSGSWCFGPDTRSLFFSEYDQRQYNNQLYLRNWKTGEKVHHLKGRPIYVTAMACSPSGQTVAVADVEAIRLWNVSTGKEASSLERHLAAITSMDVSPDGRTIATASDDRTIQLWELPSGKSLRVGDGRQGQVASVAFSPDGKSLASGGKQIIRLWDVQSARNIASFVKDESDFFPKVGFPPDGKALVVGSWTGRIYLWDVKTEKEIRSLDVQSKTVVGPMSILLGVKKLACLPVKGTNRLYDLDSGALVRRFTDSEVEFPECHLVAAAFSPDGNLLATANSYRGVYLREAATGQIISSVKITDQGPRVQLFSAPPGSPTSSIVRLAFSSDSRLVAAGYDSGKVVLWDLVRGKELHAFHGHRSRVQALAFTPNGKYLVTGSQDGTALIWNVPDSVRHPQWEGKALTDAELGALQSDLSGTDARKAFLAIETLAAAPEKSIPFLRRRLRPAAAMDAKRVPQLIEDLDSDQFAVREAATRELAKLSDRAEAKLRSALEGKPSLEARQRIENLLRAVETETQYASRAVMVLERIGTPEARQVLQDLAQGDAAAWRTRIARAARERIARCQVTHPQSSR